MMRRFFMLLTILLTLTNVACTERSVVQEDTASIKRVGYYEDFQNSRVLAFEFAPGTPAEEIREHAESLSYTSERLLAAYYYEEGSNTIPANSLRWARSIMHANDLLYDTPDLDQWHYAFMRTFIGESRFTDCTHSPGDALCRKEVRSEGGSEE
jgi:hypothetical protein